MPLTDAQRMHCAHILRARAFDPKPTVEDIRLLLNEVARLEVEQRRLDHALDVAIDVASGKAFTAAFPEKRS